VRAEGSGDTGTLGDVDDVDISGLQAGDMLRRNASSQWVAERTPFILSMFIPGTHGDGALMAQLVFDRDVAFAENLPGSEGLFAGHRDRRDGPRPAEERRQHRHDHVQRRRQHRDLRALRRCHLRRGRPSCNRQPEPGRRHAGRPLHHAPGDQVATIQFIEGFDFYQNLSNTTGVGARWTINSTSGAALVSGRFGGQAFRHSGTTQRYIERSLPATSTLAMGLAIRIEDASEVDGDRTLIVFRNSAGNQCGVGINSSGQLIVFRGGITAVLGTGAGIAFLDGIWYYLEIEVVVHDSEGSIVVSIDGDEELSVTGVDTKLQTGDDITMVRLFGAATTSANPNLVTWDDIYLNDAGTRLGPSRVDTLRPSADTADADWTPSAGGDHYEQVDEAQVDGDTSYVAASNPGDLDLYEMGELGFTPATVHAVQVTMVARKDDAEVRQLRTKLKSGTTTADDTARGMATSYLPYGELYEADPTPPWPGHPARSTPCRSASRW
jgi:hypothetical protein